MNKTNKNTSNTLLSNNYNQLFTTKKESPIKANYKAFEQKVSLSIATIT